MITNTSTAAMTSAPEQSSQNAIEGSRHSGTPQDRLTHFLEETLEQGGYELVAIEVINHREKALRVFIDHLDESKGGIGIEDCIRANELLDQPLEIEPSVNEVFKGAYELEVSSPGIQRPLRKSSDFTKFMGKMSRFHTYRPLSADESQASAHVEKNPKQKNFFGILRGFENETQSVLLGVVPEDGTYSQPTKKGQKKKGNPQK